MTPGPRKRGLKLSGGVRSPPQVPRRSAGRRARPVWRAHAPSAKRVVTRAMRGVERDSCVYQRSVPLYLRRELRVGRGESRKRLPPPRDSGGRGTTGARAASEPWWRGRLTRRVVVVAGQSASAPRSPCAAGVALSPAPLPPRFATPTLCVGVLYVKNGGQ